MLGLYGGWGGIARGIFSAETLKSYSPRTAAGLRYLDNDEREIVRQEAKQFLENLDL